MTEAIIANRTAEIQTLEQLKNYYFQLIENFVEFVSFFLIDFFD